MATDRPAHAGGGDASPPYPFLHEGTVIVCGNAWTLHDDLARARGRFLDAPVIAVNGAAGQVRAFALFTQHPRKLPRWIEMQRSRFHERFTVHAAGKWERMTRMGRPLRHEYVDHWWPSVASGGTSVWGARRMVGFMGFDRVILCGAPLEPGGYADNEPMRLMRHKSLMLHYRHQIEQDTDWHQGVSSMSGWTREFFGEP